VEEKVLMMNSTYIGLFRDRQNADAAVDELRRLGIAKEDISIVARGREGQDRFSGWGDDDRIDHHSSDDVGAGEGAAVGGMAGLLIGAGLMLIPGIGPILAVGPIAAGLAGAVTGAVAGAITGGIAGGLIDLGVPEEDARYYEREVGSGAYLVTVNCRGRESEVREIMRRHGAENVSAGGTTATTGTTPEIGRHMHDRPNAAMGDSTRMNRETGGTVELREEELRAQRHSVEAGEVEVRKNVVTEHRTIDVPVTHEEVTVERRQVAGRPATGAPIGESETINVPVRAEEVTVEKRPVVTEEVSIGKRPVTETKQVSGTVRREEAVIDTDGDVDVNERGRDERGREPLMPPYVDAPQRHDEAR